jgi:hypothetical protein
MDNSNTLGILKQLERGEINLNEAEARLNAPLPKIEHDFEPRLDTMDVPDWVRQLWVYPLAVGLLLVCFGGWVIAATANANMLWWLLGLPIVLLGSLVIAIAASARSGHWLYVNVKDAGTHNIRFGVPLPLGLARAALWVARWFVPMSSFRAGKNRMGFDDWDDVTEILAAFERELNERRGITVNVDDDDERVQVYIV